MADILAQLLDDLRAEGDDLDALVAGLEPEQWQLVTPAEPWTIRDTIGHLLWTDRVALVAATDPDAFQALAGEEFAKIDPDGGDPVAQLALLTGAEFDDPAELLSTWREARKLLADALLDVPDGVKLPWFGPPMAPASKATARLMETWAHGHDVAHTLGVSRPPTARLRHVAHLAFRTRRFVYGVNEMELPDVAVRLELTAPDGTTWSFGDEDAPETITGSAYDFCLVAVQRLHRDDTDLVASGPAADEWLDIVQAFAGPPGEKRAPGEGHR